MCPVKSNYRTPHNRIKILVKDAKQLVNGPYMCPQCKKEILKILADPNKKEVYAFCPCGVEEKLPYAPVFQPIDYYSKFMDIYKRRIFEARQKAYADAKAKVTQKTTEKPNP
jgi:transcription elongation factor Elf1